MNVIVGNNNKFFKQLKFYERHSIVACSQLWFSFFLFSYVSTRPRFDTLQIVGE
jgi:hypothetical protein